MASIETRQSIAYNCILLSFHTLNIFFRFNQSLFDEKEDILMGVKNGENPPPPPPPAPPKHTMTQCPWQDTLSQDERSQEPLRKTIRYLKTN